MEWGRGEREKRYIQQEWSRVKVRRVEKRRKGIKKGRREKIAEVGEGRGEEGKGRRWIYNVQAC